MTRTLCVCADDYGMTDGISSGILRLARARRIGAISCITTGVSWKHAAKRLSGVPDSIDIGLHLNLTEGRPVSTALAAHWREMPRLSTLIVRAHLGMLPRAELRDELKAQVLRFVNGVGRAPRFIDGHQHVHHLPGIRDILLEVAAGMRPAPALRNTGRLLGPGFASKRWLIEKTGGRALQTQLLAHGFAHNPALLGSYDFVQQDYRSLVQQWLAELPPEGGLLFCHPGEHDAANGGIHDAIAASRMRELAYLQSAEFDVDLAEADVRLGHVW